MKLCQCCGTGYNPTGEDPRAEILCDGCIEDDENALDIEFQLEIEGHYKDTEGLE